MSKTNFKYRGNLVKVHKEDNLYVATIEFKKTGGKGHGSVRGVVKANSYDEVIQKAKVRINSVVSKKGFTPFMWGNNRYLENKRAAQNTDILVFDEPIKDKNIIDEDARIKTPWDWMLYKNSDGSLNLPGGLKITGKDRLARNKAIKEETWFFNKAEVSSLDDNGNYIQTIDPRSIKRVKQKNPEALYVDASDAMLVQGEVKIGEGS